MNVRTLLHTASSSVLAWLMVAALTTVPAVSTGHIVCVRGMAQAGPSCPLCHGERAPTGPPCCKWIESAPTNGVHVTGPTLEPPASQWILAMDLAIQQPRTWTSAWLHPAAGRTGISPPQTTILRL